MLLGDELDSPRGRIYLIKEMLEKRQAAGAQTVKHVDRCLSCLSCVTTCPSGVDYMHLVDHARNHIEQNFERPLARAAVPAHAGRRAQSHRAVQDCAARGHSGRVRRRCCQRACAVLLALAPATLPAPASRKPGSVRGTGSQTRASRVAERVRAACRWRLRSTRPPSAC